jgi:hypothetical protein
MRRCAFSFQPRSCFIFNGKPVNLSKRTFQASSTCRHMDIIPNMESELAYSFKKSWSPPASPSRDHHLGNARPVSPVSPRSRTFKTVIRSSTPSPRRSPKPSAARLPYNTASDDEARLDPSVEAEKAEEFNDLGERHTSLPIRRKDAPPEWNDNVRWEDCVAFASEVELSPREHPLEWLTHALKDKKKLNPLHWPTLKERTSFSKEERANAGGSDKA